MKEDIGNQIYEQRLLVFIETEPQSNKYNQVLLNEGQFKKVSDAICLRTFRTSKNKENYETAEIQESEEEYELPDLQSIFTNIFFTNI